MYSVVVAFGLASVMLCIGMAIRAKVKFFQHMLMPVSVIGGILGFILMNLVLSKYPVGGVSVTDFSNIVDVFFVMSFMVSPLPLFLKTVLLRSSASPAQPASFAKVNLKRSSYAPQRSAVFPSLE